MIKAIAIDDEAPALKVIGNFCARTNTIQLQHTFRRPAEALGFLRQNPVDLVFLDIQMPSQSGLELYKTIGPHTLAIFTTAHSEYAVEGFNLNAVDYLLKPFTLERFQQAVAKAAEYLALRNVRQQGQFAEALLIRADYSLVRIDTADILFVEAADDYLKIHRENKPPLTVRMTMKSIGAMLPPNTFMRIHRSYIVALRRIDNVRNKLVSVNGRDLPIGTNYEAAFLKQFGR
ncbi:MAG TPA: LytTR family DNA-binding domain-containing protein [Puia sp.]|uniref:LytR/AlgR family response regulator transcription factor n=1 Tax=Puia sp. TaxID=2045100 RepID=UPI002CD24A22|nr:LytTR family DNA-binding domain-containing protein [Puia sp.]HVU94974.1 LytTR family DNA-binding domain-containing protein [Puia sp.]